MKRVILTAGPRGAGKSTFCEMVIAARPDVILVSRDAILIELFGTTELDPYTGGHYVGYEKMWEMVRNCLRVEAITLILDCWNGSPGERVNIAKSLRSSGAEAVEIWYFVTPEETTVEWFAKKEPLYSNGNSEWDKFRKDSQARSCRHDYHLYHSLPITLEQGFDGIQEINPLDPPPVEFLLDQQPKAAR